jgi:hypothetical protein
MLNQRAFKRRYATPQPSRRWVQALKYLPKLTRRYAAESFFLPKHFLPQLFHIISTG